MLEFLTAVCTCKDEAVTSNQELIHELLIGNPDNFSRITIPVCSDNGVHLILTLPHPGLQGEEQIVLDSCFKDGEPLDSRAEEIRYFTKLLELFAGMCSGKNYLNISSISAWFTSRSLIFNMWNKSLSPELRAGFGKLFKAMYIDCYARVETRRLESVRVLDIGYKKKRLTKKILRVESRLNISDIYMNATELSASNLNTISEDFEEHELHGIKEDIIEHFQNFSDNSFDELSLQLLNITLKLVKFEIIGLGIYMYEAKENIVDIKNNMFNVTETGIYKVLNSIKQALFSSIDESRYKTSTLKIGPVKRSETSIHKSVISESSSVERPEQRTDPIANEGKYIKDYFEVLLSDESDSVNYTDTEIECKIKILEIMNFILDWRQDRLITNIIECIKKCIAKKQKLNREELVGLIPPIINFFNYEGEQRPLERYDRLEVPDLAWMGKDLLKKLLKLFIVTNNYQMQSLILRIIMRCYNQRSKLLRCVNKLSIIDNKEEADLFNWLKINMTIFSELCQQTEIWISFYKPNASYDRNFKKYQKIMKILKNLDTIMLKDSWIDKGRAYKQEGAVKISNSRQLLIAHLNLHLKIVGLIRDGIHNLEEVYDDPQSGSEILGREKLEELYSLAFRVLTKFATSNKTTQKELFKYSHIFTQNLRMNLGQQNLLIEIFRNNSDLCSEITEGFLQQFIVQIENEGRQARFIELFPVIQVVNSQPMHEIQRLVFKVFAQGNNFRYLLYLDENRDFDYKTYKESVNPNYLDEPVLYHKQMIETIGISSMGTKNLYLTEVKCQNLFNIKQIFIALEASEAKFSKTVSLRIPLLKLFYYTYVESERYLEDLFRNQNFIEYLVKHTGRNHESEEFIEIMLEILVAYTVRYIKHERYVYDTFDDFDAIKQFLSRLEINGLSEEFSKKNSTRFEVLNEYYGFKLDQLEASMHEVYFLQSDISSLAQNEWKSFKDQLIYSDILKSSIKEEKNALLNIIIKIQDYLDGISFEEFLIKIVKYIRQAHAKNPPVSILINCINFIVSILSKNTEISRSYIQSKLCELGLVKVVLTIMCDKNTIKKVYNRLVDLCIELLYDGNAKAQAEFYEFFLSSSSSEEFFARNYNYLCSVKQIKQNISIVYKTHKDNAHKILRLLQLLCENHNSVLQNYLRFQHKSNNSYNMIEAVVNLFQNFLIKKKLDSFKILSQCLDTLTEFIQGPCEGNQKALIVLKFLDISNELLSIKHSGEEVGDELKESLESFGQEEGAFLNSRMVVHLKYKLSITLLSLLEKNKDDYIISIMATSFSERIIQENLNAVYLAYYEMNDYQEKYHDGIFQNFKHNEKVMHGDSSNPQEEKKCLSVIELGFYLYHLKVYLMDYNHKIKNIVPDDYVKYTKSIFLSNQFFSDIYNLFIKMYTELRQVARKFRKAEKLTPGELTKKANDFFQSHTGRIEIALEDERIIHLYFILQPESLYLTPEIKSEFHDSVDRTSEKSKLQYLQLASRELFLEIKNEQRLDEFFTKYPIVSLITSNVRLWYTVGFLATLLLNIMLLNSYTSPFDSGNFLPTFCLESDKYGYCINSMSTDRTDKLFGSIGALQLSCSFLVLFFQILKAGPKLYKHYMQLYYKHTSRKYWRFMQKSFVLFLTGGNLRISYYLAYTIISLVAITDKMYLLYSVHLLDVLYRFPSLQNVIKSVNDSRNVLIITFVFIIVQIYYFTLWGYSRLQGYYDNQCNDLYICMLKTYDRGLKLGMAWVLLPWADGTFDVERVFFDNLYNLAILVMMMNFIKGIIYDSFFVIREQTDKNNWDREHRCFICGLEQEEIEKITSRSFGYHTFKEHNEWNYAFYIMYLNRKAETQLTELTSIETYVKECLDSEKISWFPQKNGMSMYNSEDSGKNVIGENISDLKEQLKNITAEFKNIKERTKES